MILRTRFLYYWRSSIRWILLPSSKSFTYKWTPTEKQQWPSSINTSHEVSTAKKQHTSRKRVVADPSIHSILQKAEKAKFNKGLAWHFSVVSKMSSAKRGPTTSASSCSKNYFSIKLQAKFLLS